MHNGPPALVSFLLAQLVYEYSVPLQGGRYLCFPADSVGIAVSMKRTIQYRQADRSLGEMEVDLLFPGTSRTVVRLMEFWWDAKVSTCSRAVGAGVCCRQGCAADQDEGGSVVTSSTGPRIRPGHILLPNLRILPHMLLGF
jgi:hypothetical protein